jgi:DNA-binding transcriptional LysR family regulator
MYSERLYVKRRDIVVLRDHLEKLHYFYQVAKAGSFKEASQRIAITQPSLTKSIQILEGSIDRKLFLRKPRGVQLTTEGETLYNYCHQLFSQLNDIEIKLQAPEDPMAGSLRIGTYDSIAIYFWPQFLKSILSKYPRLNIEITTGRSAEIQKLVENGELDLGFIVEPKSNQNTEVVELTTDHFVLYASTQAKPLYSDLASAPLIFMPDALAGEDNLRLFKAHPGLEQDNQRMLFKTSSLESAKEFLMEGIGLALLPRMVARRELEKGRIKPVSIEGFPKKGVGRHRIGLIYSKHKENSETLQQMISEIKQQEL